MTGGRVFPVDSLDDLPDIATKIGMELRNQYVLGYKPSDAQQRWRAGEKSRSSCGHREDLPPLNVYANTGYYAPDH